MILLQISAGQGPEECCLAVAKAWQALQVEARINQCELILVEAEAAASPVTFKSVLLSVQVAANSSQNDASHLDWISTWQGTLQWICESPYRARHPRKNWFISIRLFHLAEQENSSSIHYETCRASGPGGQHVNKTDSAVRATHVATGISVKVQTERSQFANKKLARLLIEKKLIELDEQRGQQQRSELRNAHHSLERGGAQLVFKGREFRRID